MRVASYEGTGEEMWVADDGRTGKGDEGAGEEMWVASDDGVGEGACSSSSSSCRHMPHTQHSRGQTQHHLSHPKQSTVYLHKIDTMVTDCVCPTVLY